MPGRTPRDLALFVYGRLDGGESRPSVEVLDELFQTLFISSLKTEEGAPIACSIAYVDPRNPDPHPPQRLRDDRWRYTGLANPLDYDVTQLAKIALATDPSCSSIAVYPDRNGRLKIWGMFDQQGGLQSLLTHEGEGGYQPPGVIQTQVLGLGHLIVTVDLTVLAELNGDNLVEDSVDVFGGSIVSKKLKPGFERRLAKIRESVQEKEYKFDREDASSAMGTWINTIRRVLLRTRAFRHGGAFLLTDSDVTDRLSIKYEIHYDRIPVLFESWMCGECVNCKSQDLLHGQLDDNPDYIDPAIYFGNAIAGYEADDAKEGMAGAVGFVASLSRVDGLVLMDTNLVVRGFGCEIISAGDNNCTFFHANNASATRARSRCLDLQRYGTRHRSMARYCSEEESAIGFVVSNDGPVRAFARSGNCVFCWENVQLGLSLPLRKD